MTARLVPGGEQNSSQLTSSDREAAEVYSEVFKDPNTLPPPVLPCKRTHYHKTERLPCFALALNGAPKYILCPQPVKKKSLLCLSFDACPHL